MVVLASTSRLAMILRTLSWGTTSYSPSSKSFMTCASLIDGATAGAGVPASRRAGDALPGLGGLDVGLHHAAVRAGAFHLGEVDAALLRQTPGERRGEDAAGGTVAWPEQAPRPAAGAAAAFGAAGAAGAAAAFGGAASAGLAAGAGAGCSRRILDGALVLALGEQHGDRLR